MTHMETCSSTALLLERALSRSTNFPREELLSNSFRLTKASLDRAEFRWDGRYLTIADGGPSLQSPMVIYRFAVSGSTGTKIGSTMLAASNGGAQYWIQGRRVIGQYMSGKYLDGVGVWRYPGGGSAVRTFAPQTAAT